MSVLIENLYEVKSFENNDNIVKATVSLNKNHEIFDGHFPDKSVMPGVCMIQMIKELTESATNKKLFLSSCSNIKFMAIINPDENKILHLTISYNEIDGAIKIKNTVAFEKTLALKLNATFKIM
ncbi:3-hydroxyacyl-ACP dehydratase [Kriegella sp. EG-1]|nr:3-hydroxyacyl-ACP dehydratase [Flavobacteriaceae bacterium EG-1]